MSTALWLTPQHPAGPAENFWPDLTNNLGGSQPQRPGSLQRYEKIFFDDETSGEPGTLTTGSNIGFFKVPEEIL